MSDGTGADSTLTVTNVTSSTPKTVAFITPSGVPNSFEWDSGGTWTVTLDIDANNSNVLCKARCVRLTTAGSVLQNGDWTATQDLGGNKTFVPIAPSWDRDDDDPTNRLCVELHLSTALGTPQAVGIAMGEANDSIETDIEEDQYTILWYRQRCSSARRGFHQRGSLRPTRHRWHHSRSTCPLL